MKKERQLAILLVCVLLSSLLIGIQIKDSEGKDGSFGGGSGTVSDPYIIEDVWDLQNMTSNLSAHYALANDINASVTKDWNSGAGLVPIGNSSNVFTGSLDGNGFNITDLHINRSNMNNIGLIGYIGYGTSIKDLNIVRLNITGGKVVGGLVGYNGGTVTNCSAAGNTSGIDRVGGLVGSNNGIVTYCYATGISSGSSEVGDLVGRNERSVTYCSAVGNTSGIDRVGGLIGKNYAIVTNCYATGNMSGISNVGGLVGENSGTLTNCYFTWNTSGDSNVGGLVGYNYYGTVTNCYATGNTSGSSEVGGLVGSNWYGTVSNCYATGNTIGTGWWNIGGLVGYNNLGDITSCYAIGATSGTSDYVGGLVGYNWEGSVTNCYAIGATSGTSDYVGGLVGENHGTVTNCSANGNTNGNDYVGGLVGRNIGFVINCFTSVNITGIGGYLGGLVGSGTVTNSHYNINVSMINNGHHVTNWGLFNDQYQDWYSSGFSLKISDYNQSLVPHGNYYDISSVQGFMDLLGFSDDSNYRFRLASDIDLSSVPGLYIPYFVSKEFDGGGYTISNLSVNQSFSRNLGMFGEIRPGSALTNLKIINMNIHGKNSIGGLVGLNYGTVTNCTVDGNAIGSDGVGVFVGSNGGTVTKCYATGNTRGDRYVGGFMGYNGGTVTNCYATGNTSGNVHVGGLVGSNYGTVTNCYTTGNTSGNAIVGGLVGFNYGTVTECYATGNTSGNVSVGGLVGNNYFGTVMDSYAMVTVTRSSGANTSFGGFVGLNYRGIILKCYSTGRTVYLGVADPFDKGFAGSVDTAGYYEMTGNFWDNQTSGQNSTTGNAIGKNTTEMKTIDTFVNVGWDIVHVRDHVSETWYVDEGNDYPRLYWESYVDVYPPIADAGPDQTVNEGTEVTFNGSGSSDNIRVVNWTWTFFDGYPVTIYGIESIYVFNDPGVFIVTLNVTDAAGNWNEDTMNVTVLDITPPIADAGPDQTVDEGTEVTFNGSGSRDNVRVANWIWTFNDGMENIILFGSAPSHTFNVPGIYLVTLNVTDASGNRATDTITVTVKDITHPWANAGPDQVVVMGDTVTFDGTGSSDNVGIVKFTWTFTDIVPVTMYGAQPEYVFNNYGWFVITLIVTDAAGNSFSDTMIVKVNDMIPPVAYAGPDMVVEVGTLVLFNGSGSYDNTGISNYTWKFFYGNDYIALYEVDPQFKFNFLGIYIVSLYVTDDMGWRSEDEVIVTVRDTTPPHADAGPDQIVHQGDLVIFNATDSFDNSRIVEYTWTFADGFNDVFLYDISPKYRFQHAGVFNVRLEVTDEAGLWDTDNVIITVVVSRFSVHGNVLDENGDPVEGAGVEIIASDGEMSTTVTGSDGSFSLEVPKGPFTWRISKVGYEELSGESSSGDLGDITINLKESPTNPDDDGMGIVLILISLILSFLIIVGIAIFLISMRRKEVFMEE